MRTNQFEEEMNCLKVSNQGDQLRISIPRVVDDGHYLKVLEELGKTLYVKNGSADIVVQIEQTPRPVILLTAVLFRLKQEVERSGGRFQIVGDE
jgi:hypothetical protein